MRGFLKNTFFIGALALTVAGCETAGTGGGVYGSGGGSGGGSGEVTGDAATTSGIGAIAGAYSGTSVGRQMSAQDRTLAQEATQKALERYRAGARVKWSNTETGNSGEITPQFRFEESGRTCREYQHMVNVGGSSQTGYSTACKHRDGTWRVDTMG